MRMQNDSVMSVGDSVRKPLPRARPKNWLYHSAPGQQAEEDVVEPHRAVGVVAPGVVAAVPVEAVHRVGYEAAKGDKEGGGQGAVHGVGELAEVDVLAELEAHVEAAAHKACKKGDSKALGEVEVLDSGLLFLRG